MAIDLSVAGHSQYHSTSLRNGTRCHCDATPIWHFHLICLSCALNTFRCVCISKCVAEIERWPKFSFRFMINVYAVGQPALLCTSKYFLHVNENMLCVQRTMASIEWYQPTDNHLAFLHTSFQRLHVSKSSCDCIQHVLLDERTMRKYEWTTMSRWIVCGFGIVSESLG